MMAFHLSVTRWTYGWCWVIKSNVFPDKNFELPTNLPEVIMTWITLNLFILPTALTAIYHAAVPVPVLGAGLIVFFMGSFTIFVADSKPRPFPLCAQMYCCCTCLIRS